MPLFRTKKAQPGWLRRTLEAVVALACAVWLAACTAVMLDELASGMDIYDVLAYAILWGLPLWLLLTILGAWRLRRKAGKLTAKLAWETKDEIPWATLDEHTGMNNTQALVEKLFRKGYLRNVAPDFDKLTLHRAAIEAEAAEVVLRALQKCPMCGATLEMRTFGDWACRYCGTVVGK